MGKRRNRRRKAREQSHEPPKENDQDSLHTHLADAISLLALLNPPLPHAHPAEENPNSDNRPDADCAAGNFNIPTEEDGSSPPASEEPENEDDEEVDLEDLNTYDLPPESAEKEALSLLQDKLLDRLAETLARYKSDPKKADPRTRGLDAKHVCAAMMRVHAAEERAEIVCAKNEGLDAVDRVFLEGWKRAVEGIARSGGTDGGQREGMERLVREHQRPRIEAYVGRLREAFRMQGVERAERRPPRAASLCKVELDRVPVSGTLEWEDDHGLRYTIVRGPVENMEQFSNAAHSGETLQGISADIAALETDLRALCADPVAEELASSAALARLMSSTYRLWRGVRTRSAFRTSLSGMFPMPKARGMAERALLFLCRIHYSVAVFVEAAERIPALKSITCIPVPWNRISIRAPGQVVEQMSPLEAAARLQVPISSHDLRLELDTPEKSARYDVLRREQRHVHAEIQVLFFRETVLGFASDGWTEHLYIGCSKLCCYLCCCFLLACRRFRFRGTHGAFMNRWAVPPTNTENSPLHLATERLFMCLKLALRESFSGNKTATSSPQRAQSTADLSTAKEMLEEEVAKLEESMLPLRYGVVLSCSFLNDFH
ncbi:hypothetical protein BU26DRAFT_297265 [Trematosphaeria pertusa]|uniref:Uncharacterized protein n=1 Tax=Trematosphaeria pertusa TaxID=390896 RepID=A0A6A6IJH9_9PLEO|nr:uncharacterized protein BU26DRAFT_297265 [Trematosphaeria pertusa]KAF2250218.1 hypothetical protein BU26DRAFT_297265 [Trematosphaeria pertusa]